METQPVHVYDLVQSDPQSDLFPFQIPLNQIKSNQIKSNQI